MNDYGKPSFRGYSSTHFTKQYKARKENRTNRLKNRNKR
jgi:hypothetical protein